MGRAKMSRELETAKVLRPEAGVKFVAAGRSQPLGRGSFISLVLAIVTSSIPF